MLCAAIFIMSITALIPLKLSSVLICLCQGRVQKYGLGGGVKGWGLVPSLLGSPPLPDPSLPLPPPLPVPSPPLRSS